jgi:hypothetical protein
VPGAVHAVQAAEAQPDHSAVLVQGHATSSLDDGIVREDPGILASLVDDPRLVLIEELELLRDRVHPDMLLAGQSLLEIMGSGSSAITALDISARRRFLLMGSAGGCI